MTTDTAQSAATATATTETTETCSYSSPGYNPPPRSHYFDTVGDAPLPGGGTLEVRFRSLRTGTSGSCSLADSISEAQTSSGRLYFAGSNGKLNCHSEMRAPLTAFANTVNYFSTQCGPGYGTLQTIGHWGGQRPRDLCERFGDSYHCGARAIDIYWLEWSGGVVSRPCNGAAEASSSVAAHRRLVAVEAGLRRCFGYVLARNISGHYNHFHADNGCSIALRLKSGIRERDRKFTSCNYFIRDCVAAFVVYTDDEQSAKPGYEWDWDAKAKAGYRRLLSDFGMSELDPVRYVNHYMIFLDFVMMHGFANRAAGAYRWGRVPVL